MAIAGIGSGIGLNILPTRQDLAPASERNNSASSRQSETGATSGTVSRTVSEATTSVSRFDPPTAGNQVNPLIQDRRNPADIEALRNQFGLQSEARQQSPNRAIDSFVTVAEFEQRDEIASATGIDIFV